ncbi:hypothetical protein QBC44DRAFT_387944 [Cladorrhinum sp. PSN332]|nr:hypothetical protein QBC44DRAFT_387944 [Cladorrhinum sp. PSN332]
MCAQKFFEVETSIHTHPICPCSVSNKIKILSPGRKCNGWTCEPGTHTKWIDAPCGITITTTKVDLCGLVRGAMGNVGEQFISKASAVCSCLPKALDMLGKELFKSVQNGMDFSAAVSTMIKDIMQLQKCVIDNGFKVQDNKAQVMAGDLSAAGGWTVVPAAEIDLASYGELAAAISPCLVGACQPDLIRSFFTNYLTKSKTLMADKIVVVLKEWTNILGKVEKGIKDIGSATENLFIQIKTVPSKIEEVEDKVCKDDACLGPVISEYFKKVSEAIATVQTFQDVQNATATIVEVVPKIVALIESSIEIAEAIPDVSYFLQLIVEGKLRKIEDILESIKITKELPALVTKLQKSASTIIEFITLYTGRGKATLALLENVLSTAWEGYPLEFTTDSSGNVRAGLIEIQTMIQTQVMVPFRNVTNSINALDDVLTTLPIKAGKFDLKAGVASYRRWSTVSMDLPCTRQARKKYEVAGGFKGSFDYPEFYSCKYGPKEVPWPNHHIPYLKFRIR